MQLVATGRGEHERSPARACRADAKDHVPEVTADLLRAAASRFPTGVTVVTVIDDGLAHGITVNSFTSVSLRPPLVLVCLNGSGATCRLVRRHGRFAVNVLARDQRALAAYFADPDRPAGRRQFETLAWRPAPSGMPLLDDAVAWFDCVVEQMVTAGDHDVVVGRVLDVSWHAEEPLVFCGGEYTGATPGPMRKVAHRHTWEPRSSQ